MKKVLLLFLSIFVCTTCFSSCDLPPSAGATAIDEEYPQSGFITPSGPQMVETPEGFYSFQGNYLYFTTPDLQKSTVLCGKPECTHNATSITDLYSAAQCNAFFMEPQIGYYNNHLYIAARNPQAENNDLPTAVYRVSMDGSEKELFAECGQFIRGLCVYQGDMYIADVVYEEAGKKDRIRKISMDDPDDIKTIFETTDYPENTLNRFTCYDGSCYFFFTPGEQDSTYRYLTVDLETGVSEVLFEADSDLAILYENDYGCIIEDQTVTEKNENGDWLWESSYYRIAPGDTKAVPLTEKDIPLLAENPWLYNLDDTYIYFATMSHSSWSEESWPEDASIYVCNYQGEIAATLPIPDEFHGKIFYVLPGTDNYMFVQLFDYNEAGRMDRYYYAPKSEFGDGAVVQLKEIPLQ